MAPKQMRVSDQFLPLDIFFGILLLLPPKIIVQLMCVCRSWRNLIRDAKFIRAYFENSTSKGEGFLLYLSMFGRNKMSFKLLNDKTFVVDSRFRFLSYVNLNPLNVRIVGSSRGVVCLSEFYSFELRKIYLCNPLIRKYKLINPPSTIDIRHAKSIVLGFAYHSQMDDFKVVRIVYGKFRQVFGVSLLKDEEYDVCVEIYSLNSNSWKAIKVASFTWYIYEASSEVLVNESLHWLASDGGFGPKGQRVILAFDLKKEIFREEFLPPGNEWGEQCKLMDFLGVFQGELAVFSYRHHDFGSHLENCELWVMKEYGNEDSWNKLYAVRMDIGIDKPLKITNNKEIILVDDKEFVLIYNFCTHAVTYLDTLSPVFVPFTKSLALIDQ